MTILQESFLIKVYFQVRYLCTMTHGQVIQYSMDHTCRGWAKETQELWYNLWYILLIVLILVVHVDLTVIYIKPFTKNKDFGIVLCLKNIKNHCVNAIQKLCQCYSKTLKSWWCFFYSQTRTNHELGRQVQICIRSVSTKALRIYEETH